MHIIIVPPKMWIPKVSDRFVPLPPHPDIDDNTFLFQAYVLVMRRTKHQSPQPSIRDNIILWNEDTHHPKLHKYLHLRDDMDTTVYGAIWASSRRTGMLLISRNFVVPSLDATSASILALHPPFVVDFQDIVSTSPNLWSSRSPLEDKKWIQDRKGIWRSMILLAPQPRQEGVTSTNEFVWRFCVSYRTLNTVTKLFVFPIPRYAGSIEEFGNSNEMIFFTTLDTRQGYHQIAVRHYYQEKIAFFTPGGSKKIFVVMLFDPKNKHYFYMVMMKKFQREWNAYFFTKKSLTHPIRLPWYYHLLVVKLFVAVELWSTISSFTQLTCSH